jgi:transposase
MVKYRVVLTADERQELHGMLGKGRCAARKLTRARILLLTDEGRSERDIASILSVSRITVEHIRRRCAEEGVAAALAERKRPGAGLKLDERAQARLIAEACSTPGDGRVRWTLKLLADRVVELGLAESIAPETVRSYLKKTTSSRGRSRSGAFPR